MIDQIDHVAEIDREITVGIGSRTAARSEAVVEEVIDQEDCICQVERSVIISISADESHGIDEAEGAA